MSFAIYGESQTYVHLTSGDTREGVIEAFLRDVREVDVDLGSVFNIFAVENSREDRDLENEVIKLIWEAGNVTQ